MRVTEEPITYSRPCRDCGNRIFMHTNGDGGWVLFDELGPPWPIHPCFANRREGRARIVTERSQYGYDSSVAQYPKHLHRTIDGPDEAAVTDENPTVGVSMDDGEKVQEIVVEFIPLYGDPVLKSSKAAADGATRTSTKNSGVQAAKDSKDVAEDGRYSALSPDKTKGLRVQRCDPAYFVNRDMYVVGFVRELYVDRGIDRLFPTGSIGYRWFVQSYGVSTFSMLTVIDSNLLSYDVVVPIGELDLEAGGTVGMAVRGTQTLGAPIFVCQSLERIEFHWTNRKAV